MTKQGITMTTNPDIILFPDLSKTNDASWVPNTTSIEAEIKLSAITLVRDTKITTARSTALECLANAANKLCSITPNYNLKLYLGHSTWQPNSAICRFKKLWKSLEARGINIESKKRSEELLFESSDGIRFGGWINFSIEEIDTICSIIKLEPVSVLIWEPSPPSQAIINDKTAVHLILKDNDITSPNRLLTLSHLFCQLEKIAFFPFGNFDDNYAGVSLIMNRHQFTDIATHFKTES